jgi:hypothetical protein
MWVAAGRGPTFEAMATELTCVCGVVVTSREELDAFGLCFDCSAREPGQACDCPECEAARERVHVAAAVVRLRPRGAGGGRGESGRLAA